MRFSGHVWEVNRPDNDKIMARIEEKIAEIPDAQLRQAIAEEVAKLKKHTRFGLVFEEHQPEVVPVHGARIKRGERVAKKTGSLTEIWRVLKVADGHAVCEKEQGQTDKGDGVGECESFNVEELVVVRRMGEAIYPALTTMDAVSNGDPAQPHHILIEADNYHALQLLLFPYENKVDCIYIDPPYNTGARDWKYNNDYVDGNDTWRHSKWLSMMQRRLRLAKRLLNPSDSVLIVTIDEKEYLRLGLLLEQTFPEANIQMVSVTISPRGTNRPREFSRVDEYAYFVFMGEAMPGTREVQAGPDNEVRWQYLRRDNTGSERVSGRPNQFYPIYVSNLTHKIVSVGSPLSTGERRDEVTTLTGALAVFPVKANGVEMVWGLTGATLKKAIAGGFVRVVPNPTNSHQPFTISFVSGLEKNLASGAYKVIGKRTDGSSIVVLKGGRVARTSTVWRDPSHDAGAYGTSILGALLPNRKFPFPKSLYAVEDCLRVATARKPNALILDFFAGSGTTAHAVMRLNRQDGGHRQCIAVTNNEVAADEQAALCERGLQPGHLDWEKWGICNHITYPRLAAAITGKTQDGEPIKGDYKFTDEFPMAEGFAANLEYFRLDFLEPAEVQMGRQFAAILPLLWMMAGARGRRPAAPDPHAPWLVPAGCPFAVLIQETHFKDFARHVDERPDITHIFVVTNSQDTLYKLRHEWPALHVVQLYKDYLENFRINVSENSAP